MRVSWQVNAKPIPKLTDFNRIRTAFQHNYTAFYIL